MVSVPWESVEATDRYTVTFKLQEPRLRALNLILDWYQTLILPPRWSTNMAALPTGGRESAPVPTR